LDKSQSLERECERRSKNYLTGKDERDRFRKRIKRGGDNEVLFLEALEKDPNSLGKPQERFGSTSEKRRFTVRSGGVLIALGRGSKDRQKSSFMGNPHL